MQSGDQVNVPDLKLCVLRQQHSEADTVRVELKLTDLNMIIMTMMM